MVNHCYLGYDPCHDPAECERLAKLISAEIEIADCLWLYSTKEYNKGQVGYLIDLV